MNLFSVFWVLFFFGSMAVTDFEIFIWLFSVYENLFSECDPSALFSYFRNRAVFHCLDSVADLFLLKEL